MRVLFWQIQPPDHLLTSDGTASLGEHVWYAQLGQIPKVTAALTSKDKTTVQFL